MPHRDRETTWRRVLDDARALAAQPPSAYAGRVPTVRRALDKLTGALAEAQIAGADLDLIDEIQGEVGVLADKLAEAEGQHDAILRSPIPDPPSSRFEWPSRAELRSVAELLEGPDFDEWRSTLVRAAGGIPLPEAEVEHALVQTAPLLLRARWRFEWATTYRPAYDNDDALRGDWETFASLLRRVEVACAVLEARRRGEAGPDPYAAAEEELESEIERIRSRLRRSRHDELVSSAMLTRRGMQLRVCQVAFHSLRTDAARNALVDAMLYADRGPVAREDVERDLPLVEGALTQARALLARAEADPEPADAETEAALAEPWRELAEALDEAEDAVARAKAWLGRA